MPGKFLVLQTNKSLLRKSRMRNPLCVFAIIVTVMSSDILFSGAFLNPSLCRKIDNRKVTVHAESVLFASANPTAKSGRKRKPKHLRKKKKSNSSSSLGAEKIAEFSPGRSISKDELYNHLDERINFGTNGPLGPRVRARGIIYRDDDKSDSNVNYTSERQRDQQFFLRQLNNRPTLVLNANYLPLGYMPLSLWSWQDAIKAVFKGSVTVVDVYPDLTVRAANMNVPLPSVIALNDYVPQKSSKASFTRRNVYLRDEYICQYCNKRFHPADLSLDHVVPRSMGGPLSWENAVTCCKACNTRKGSTPLSELGHKGMKLLRKPRAPSQMELAAISGRMIPKRVHPTWEPYLGIQERKTASIDASEKVKGDEEFIDERCFKEKL